jgi:hypothetical protein
MGRLARGSPSGKAGGVVEEDEAPAMGAGGRARDTAEGHAEGREAARLAAALVEDTMSFGRLHVAVQAAMGWENSHLHLFLVVGGEQIGDPRQLDHVAEEARVTVRGLPELGGKSFATSTTWR